MSNPQPFRLLDLPKGLRLLIFSHLSIKITHHPWKSNTRDPDPSVKLLWPLLPGVQILSTSRQIQDEAALALKPRLHAMKSADIRIIASTKALGTISFYVLLDYLRHMNGPGLKQRCGVDVTNRLSWTALDAGGRQEMDVLVAVRSDEGQGEGEELNGILQQLGRMMHMNHATLERKRHTRGVLDVHFLLAPRTEAERAVYDLKQPLRKLDVLGQDETAIRASGERWTRGEYIEEEEWERDWVEG